MGARIVKPAQNEGNGLDRHCGAQAAVSQSGASGISHDA